MANVASRDKRRQFEKVYKSLKTTEIHLNDKGPKLSQYMRRKTSDLNVNDQSVNLKTLLCPVSYHLKANYSVM